MALITQVRSSYVHFVYAVIDPLLFHTAFLYMTNYYATAYKTGTYPTITEDSIHLWARPHPKDANAPDSVGKPTNFELVSALPSVPLSEISVHACC